MTNNTHIHRQQRGKFPVSMQNAVNAFALQLIPQILEFTEEIAMDHIEMPEMANECDECEEWAMDSEDAFSNFLVEQVLRRIRSNI
jgi:hypothetical protein